MNSNEHTPSSEKGTSHLNIETQKVPVSTEDLLHMNTIYAENLPKLQKVLGAFLNQAAAYGEVDVVEYILKLENNLDHKVKKSMRYTALLQACENPSEGSVAVVKALISEGFEDIVNVADTYDETALMHAAKKGNLEVVEALLNGISLKVLNAVNKNGKTALMLAAEKGHIAVVKSLLEKGAKDWINAQSLSGKTALMYAAEKNHLDIVKVLLDHQADVGLPDSDQTTPLMSAAAKGYQEVVEVLLKAHANIQAPDKQGKTALMFAAENGSVAVVQALLGGISRSMVSEVLNHTNAKGKTALMLAAENGYIKVVKYLLEKGAKVQIEEEAKDHRSSDGKTALMHAAEHGSASVVHPAEKDYAGVVEALIEAGAKLNEAEKFFNKRTALMLAAAKGNLDVVEALLKVASEEIVNAVDKNGKTVLMLAAANGHLGVVKALVHADPASIHFVDKDGKTALMYADQKKHSEVASFLENLISSEMSLTAEKQDASGVPNDVQSDAKRNPSQTSLFTQSSAQLGNQPNPSASATKPSFLQKLWDMLKSLWRSWFKSQETGVSEGQNLNVFTPDGVNTLNKVLIPEGDGDNKSPDSCAYPGSKQGLASNPPRQTCATPRNPIQNKIKNNSDLRTCIHNLR